MNDAVGSLPGEIEDRFERGMRTFGLLAGPLVALAVFLINPGDQAPEARRLLAILTLAIFFWATEAIPLPATALLASALAILVGVAPAKEVLAPYANPIIFLFVGTFLLAEAFRKFGLDRRVAAPMLGRGPFARSRLGRILGVGVASAAISTCISNTASAALMTPIAIGACRDDGEGGSPTGRLQPWTGSVLLMIAYGASIGGIATLVGTPPNLLVAGFLEQLTGVRVGFVDWLLFGVPIALVLFVSSIIWTTLSRRGMESRMEMQRVPVPTPGAPPAAGVVAAAGHAGEESARGIAIGARLTMAAFALAAVLWTLPSLTAILLGRSAPLAVTLHQHLPEAGVALFCATLLFVVPVDWRRRRFALTWREGQQVNWGIILLFGGGLSLGTLAAETGVSRWVGEGLQEFGLARTGPGLLFCAIALSIVVSEFASNTAATTLLVPMVIAAAEASGLDPIRPAIGVGLAATCGFIFPVSTPPNAIVFGTGLVPLRHMIRAGILLDLTALFVVWAGLLILTPILPR